MIDLNELNRNDNQQEVVIFNNGDAGRVKNVKVEVVKKTTEDNPNSPDYKIFYIDENGGKVNDGVYYPDSNSRNPKFTLTRLINVLHSLNPSLIEKPLPKFEEYVEAVDFLMKQIIINSKNGRVNIFVNYGVKDYPKQYLTVRKINFVESITTSDNLTRLKPIVNTDENKQGYNDLMTRVEETSFDSFDEMDNMSLEDTDSNNLPESDDLGW